MYFFVINENNVVGDYIVQVLVVDDDVGINVVIRYQFYLDFYNMFVINLEIGVIIVNLRFDREINFFYKFIVIVMDGGSFF